MSAKYNNGKKPVKRSWFKLRLRGQQVVLFLLVSLIPLLIVTLFIKIYGENALKSSVGDGLIQLAREKLYRIDRAISERIGRIRAELPNLRSAVAASNTATRNLDVYADVNQRLEDSLRLLESYARSGIRRWGYRTEVIITNKMGDVISSNRRELDFNLRRDSTQKIKNVKTETWWKNAYNNHIGSYYIEDVKYDADQKVYFLPVSLPIYSRSNRSNVSNRGNRRTPERNEQPVIGVLRTILILPELSSIIEPRPGMEKTYTILTSESGKVIASSPNSGYQIDSNIDIEHAAARAIVEAKKARVEERRIRKEIETADNENQINRRDETRGRREVVYHGYEADGETDRNNESRVYGWARTRILNRTPWKREQNFSNWIVFVSYPSAEAYIGVARLNQYVLLVTLLSCVIVIPVAYVAAKRISLPVMQLAETAKRIGQDANKVIQDDTDQVRSQIANMQWLQDEESDNIAIDSKNEVGVLAEEFNDMHRNLKIAVEKLINAEQQMTTIVDCLSEGLIVVDMNDKILYFNPAAKYLLNYNETAEFPERFTELIRTTDLTVLANVYGKDSRTTVEINLDQEDENRVLRVVTSQFESIDVNTNGEDATAENGNLTGMIYVFDDITREHEIDRMKSDFVALVSHELRTPLTSIIGFISLVLDGKVGQINDKQEQSLTRAHRQSQRLATMISDLLDISRIEAGRIVMKLEPVEMVEIAQQRLEELKPQADEKEILLDLNAPSDLPKLTGDTERIGQILTNLIGNAIKFTPTNGKVSVRMSRKACPVESDHTIDENDGVHVEVIDTGPGIPEQERENVFDKFQQLGNVQTREQGGTGLGLSIARGFVEAHKGTIWVDTGENGNGCNFQFWIPLIS